MSDIANKLWSFCHTLRHDGVDYGDYIEELTYLLFLKMADEKGVAVPPTHDWNSLTTRSGTDLLDHYTDTLRALREETGILGKIFTAARTRLTNPVNLKRLLNLINEIEWSELGVDVKGAAFEGLLEKSASEGKKGAGQYFTPRELIRTIVRVMQPDPRTAPDFRICDPSCGTGGFLVEAYEWLMQHSKGGALDRDIVSRVRQSTYFGQELVPRPARLAMMNLYLHGVTTEIHIGDTLYDPFDGQRYDCILTNPPFGTKGANQAPEREDFTISTSNKQLNFMQHYLSALRPGGRAAVVLPDNVLFEDKAGEVFRILMRDCRLHTVLRLPRGTFTPYAQGVKANVVFFQKGQPTAETWIYDARSNVLGITKKDRPLTAAHFADFEAGYGKDPSGRSQRTESERFRKFTLEQIRSRDYKLDITWLKDDSIEDADDLPAPTVLAHQALAELEAASADIRTLLQLLKGYEK